MHYVRAGLNESTADFEDGFVWRLQRAVRNIKESREMEERYMVFEELIKEEREEAKEEGRVEGIAMGNVEAVLALVTDLGEILDQLREKILGETDLEILKIYLKKAARAESIEEFERFIKEV